ncbi:hypothetical protein MTO96_011807 [Rhipicephalus appendiculatus]
MLLSVERDVVMMQEEAVKPPPSTASSGLRATDFSIAAIMARESPGQQPASASWPPGSRQLRKRTYGRSACSKPSKAAFLAVLRARGVGGRALHARGHRMCETL